MWKFLKKWIAGLGSPLILDPEWLYASPEIQDYRFWTRCGLFLSPLGDCFTSFKKTSPFILLLDPEPPRYYDSGLQTLCITRNTRLQVWTRCGLDCHSYIEFYSSLWAFILLVQWLCLYCMSSLLLCFFVQKLQVMTMHDLQIYSTNNTFYVRIFTNSRLKIQVKTKTASLPKIQW